MTRQEGRSLSLFDEATPEPTRGHDPNLEAARRLARRIGRLPDHSPAQVQAGQRLCRYLLAMLRSAEAEQETREARH